MSLSLLIENLSGVEHYYLKSRYIFHQPPTLADNCNAVLEEIGCVHTFRGEMTKWFQDELRLCKVKTLVKRNPAFNYLRYKKKNVGQNVTGTCYIDETFENLEVSCVLWWN